MILSEQDGILSEQGGGDELACWRIIRELRGNLPCVYVARRATQRFLEQALSLSVTSVLTHPVESVILASPEPIAAAQIAAVLPRCNPSKVRLLVQEINAEYVEQRRAFEIWEVAGGYQLRSLPESMF